MPQYSKVFVKIVNYPFRPMNLPINYVWQCTDVIARYVMALGGTGDSHAVLCDKDGNIISPPWGPTPLGAQIEDDADTTIEIVYDMAVDVTDLTGWTVTGATALSISAVNNTLLILVSASIAPGAQVILDYNALTGNVENTGGKPTTTTISGYKVQNNVSA